MNFTQLRPAGASPKGLLRGLGTRQPESPNSVHCVHFLLGNPGCLRFHEKNSYKLATAFAYFTYLFCKRSFSVVKN